MIGCNNIKASFNNNVLMIKIYGEIDHHNAKKLREKIDSLLIEKKPLKMVLDLSLVSFMDSSGIGLILARYRFCQNTGTSLYVEGVNRQTQKILALAGIKTINDVAI